MDVDGFADPYLASLYEIECPWHPSDDYYLGLVRSAGDVLDVGCGTGIVLTAAVRAGHSGRLVGLDPAEGMLRIARTRPGVEWVHGFLADQPWRAEFDLVIMTGHAFQEFRSDDDISDFFAAAARALRPGGRLGFETRNPHARAWDGWHGAASDIEDPDGRPVHLHYDVERVAGDEVGATDVTVTFTETHSGDHLPDPLVARSTLRFAPAETLDRLLADAGFAVDERYGDWDRSPFSPDSPEIVTVASISAAR